MSYLYVNEQGAFIGISGKRIEVKYKNGMLCSIPIETLESIQVFGKIQLSTQCVTTCLRRGISVIYYSSAGSYFGRLLSPSHVNVERQRKQARLTENEVFSLAFSKRIIEAKIRNQIVVLRRYARHQDVNITATLQNMQRSLRRISGCTSIPQVMGFEGTAAHEYFHTLGMLIRPEFKFEKRSRRPPRDAFNSMISLGYSILMNEIYGKLEVRGLNPYFGILHSDREKHPTLASDMIEEWRAVIVDSVAMSLVNGKEISQDDFYESEDGVVLLAPEGFKKFIRKLEARFNTRNRYLDEEDGEINFRRAIELQSMDLVRAIEEENAELYKPVITR